MISALRILMLLTLVLLPAGRAAAQTPVDLELVLAVDISLSMDLEEQRLQRDGYIAAFRDVEVQRVILSGSRGRISVTYVEWAGPNSQHVVVPWMLIDSTAAAKNFADLLEKTQISRARMTSISAALEFSGRLLKESTFKGERRVIDVSGDGPNNSGQPVVPMRDALVADGIIINGLPILLHEGRASSFFDISNLDAYYEACVIGGQGAFVIPIRERSEFATATRRKLLLEIAGMDPEPRIIRVQAPARVDCMAGEQQWRRYMDGPYRN